MAQSKTFNRRRFLTLVGGAAGFSVLACSGLGVLATLQPSVDYAESTCGEETMSEVLVTYASKAGSTGEVAEAIAKVFCDAGATVDVRPVKEVRDLSGYRAVVLGSAIRMGSWLSEATSFVKTHKATLAQMPVAYFQVCGELEKDTEETRKTTGTYLDPVRALLEPVASEVFAGKMDFAKLSWLDRSIIKMMGGNEGDWRNWDAIHAWAEELIPALKIA
ncbi:MAG: flavodoxin domain-containing protein [Anaerolineae bacterium]|nr:flavodoxin domain-containing protein [Anaerolineae bacterium]